MKQKLIFTAIIAVVFIAAMLIFKDKNTLPELIAYFVGAGGTIVAVWNWFSKKEVQQELRLSQKASKTLSQRNNELRLLVQKLRK